MSRRNRSLIFVVAALLVLTACQSSASGEPSGRTQRRGQRARRVGGGAGAVRLSALVSAYPAPGRLRRRGHQGRSRGSGRRYHDRDLRRQRAGPDAERIQSVIAGDIDMDIQGASALSAVYAPMSAVDGAFVFDDSAHMYSFFTSDASDALTQDSRRKPASTSSAHGTPAPASSPPMFPSVSR